MAGTRLAIQAAAVAQYSLLVFAAVYFGLYKETDLVLAPFRQSGRWHLWLKGGRHVPESMPAPEPLTVAVVHTQEMAWRILLKNSGGSGEAALTNNDDLKPNQNFKIRTMDRELPAACADPSLLETEEYQDHRADIYICESLDVRDSAKVKVVGSRTLFYPSSIHNRGKEWRTLVGGRKNVAQLSKRLEQTEIIQVQVIVERGLDHSCSREILQEIESGMDKISMYPFGRGRPNLSVSQVELQEYVPSTKSNEFGIFVHLHNGTDSEAKPLSTDNSFYIPYSVPTRTVDDHQQDCVSAGRELLDDITSWLIETCLHLPREFGREWEVEDDGTPSHFLLSLNYRRVLPFRISSIANRLGRAREMIIGSSRWIPIGNKISHDWLHARESLDLAVHAATESDWIRASELLYYASDLVLSLERNNLLLTPLDLPGDQMCAVFAPLLFPTLIPLILGLVREYKRYKTKRKEAKSKSKGD